MVLHARDPDPVPGSQARAQPAPGHHVDGFGGRAGEDELLGPRCADEAGDRCPRAFVGVGGRLGERIESAVDRPFAAFVAAADGLDTQLGFWVVAALSR